MGWSFYDESSSPKTHEEEKEEIVEILSYESTDGSCEVLASAKVGEVWYCAVKSTDSEPDDHRPYLAAEDGSITFGAVVLTERRGSEWGYKLLTEGCGPFAADCPRNVLDLLSPLDPAQGGEAADTIQEWRNKCSGRYGDGLQLLH